MSSNSVVSDVLSALHSIAHTKRNTPHRQDSTAGSSFLRRRDSTISVASSVKSTTSIASIKSIARSLFRHKQEDMEPVTKGKGKGKGKGKKRGSVHNPVNAEQAAIAARAAENNKFYQSQSPITVVLRDPVVLEKLLEGILDSTAGKRMVSRLARTCKAFSEPALNVLWRDLYSFIPLIGMFPSPLLRRPKKPGLGLTKVPEQADWEKVTLYGDKVRRITYEESANNVSTTVFPIFEEYRPRTYLLPGLRHLTWRAETPVGLDRCLMFLNPELQTLNLEIGTRFPQLSSFLKDVSDRTHLTSFSFASPTPLPDDFTELLAPQTDLRRVNLVAPGALSPGAGRWLGALPHLRSLQLDLTGRSVIAVEGFFDMMRPRSGDSTPDSIGSIDSGVFSADELDFSEIRKSALRLTGDLHSKGAFAKLRQLQLTGEVSNMAVFLKHLSSRLAHLELAIEDPPDRADWQDLCAVLCEHFGRSLHSLKITATGGSKFADLVRSTTKLASGGTHLTLEFLSALPALRRLEIDLPESTIFHAADLSHLAAVCPGLEELRLCPTAIFPSQTGAPKITLEDIAPLLRACKNLHTLSVVVNAQGGSQQVLHQRDVSSASLQRLHVGHSWIQDPLQVAILLSHFASRCDTLRWFHERNRPGYVEANDLGWQKVAEALPFLQDVREMERQAVVVSVVTQEPEKPETDEKGVDATVSTRNQGVSVRPITFELSVQASPTLVEACVEAIVEQVSTSVDATTPTSEASVDAVVETSESSVDAVVSTVEIAIDAVPEVEVLPEVDSAPEVKPATIPEDVANVGVVPSPTSPTSPTSVSNHIDPSAFTLSKVVEALFSSSSHNDTAASDPQPTPSEKNYARPSSYDLFFYATSALIYYPLFIPLKILDMSMSALHRKGRTSNEEEMSEKQLTSDPAPNYDDTPMDSMPGVMTPPQVRP
ncbi:hypothetical protein PC9H_003440 [Pleurotus ostreatus]|uniref:Uncharacterized protein n=1 Tax=Pleurotus ostreatus TaxID=5322 RepID=A0A8H7A1X5_PLEOS|nr:uncharacterized protein PC9H_003440 [Pleurotus ostreatus]KAF7436607.1 hypothetical protein PC9H_003440 [Pleurotus ostreatus]